MDWLQAAVTSGTVVAGIVISQVRKEARTDKRIDTVEEAQEDHGKRLDHHDSKFEQLNTLFVPRQELETVLNSIDQSQKRMERWLERLILRRTPPLDTPEE